MQDDRFNITLRTFLKEVGISSQREIEKAVREALRAGRLKDHGKIHAKMTLSVDAVDLTHVIEGEIELG